MTVIHTLPRMNNNNKKIIKYKYFKQQKKSHTKTQHENHQTISRAQRHIMRRKRRFSEMKNSRKRQAYSQPAIFKFIRFRKFASIRQSNTPSINAKKKHIPLRSRSQIEASNHTKTKSALSIKGTITNAPINKQTQFVYIKLPSSQRR